MLFAEKEEAVYAYFLKHPESAPSERDLCKALGLTPGRLYQVLVRLVMRGHLRSERFVNEGGGRKRLRVYGLTETGKMTLKLTPPAECVKESPTGGDSVGQKEANGGRLRF